ncbi:hypothetical protein BKA83DRAFT_4124389 [Pisolithus microcarpus]|nr:hypothetical protein BKA83DRAFT_4124389 [Pisolithus microcarpus]
MDYNTVYMGGQQVHADLKNGGSGMAPFQCQNPFTVAAITSLYFSPFAEGFSIGQHQVAIWALLRYGAHEDGMHCCTKSPGGLHPAYAAFNLSDNYFLSSHNNKLLRRLGENLLYWAVYTQHNPVDKTEGEVIHRMDMDEVSLGDVFDVSIVNAYITPHEVIGNEHICGDSAMLIQAFCQEFAILHLQCFTEWVPKPHLGTEPISLSRPNHLPASVSPDSSQILCMAFSPEVKPDAEGDEWHLSPSATICETVKFIPSIKKLQSPSTPTTSLCQHSTCQSCPADAFLYPTTATPLEPILLVTAPNHILLRILGIATLSVNPVFHIHAYWSF